jgi:hypothetical protein
MDDTSITDPSDYILSINNENSWRDDIFQPIETEGQLTSESNADNDVSTNRSKRKRQLTALYPNSTSKKCRIEKFYIDPVLIALHHTYRRFYAQEVRCACFDVYVHNGNYGPLIDLVNGTRE